MLIRILVFIFLQQIKYPIMAISLFIFLYLRVVINVGATFLHKKKGAQWIASEKLIVHEDYEIKPHANDIGLIRLKERIRMSGRLQNTFRHYIVVVDTNSNNAKPDIFSNRSITLGLHGLPYGKRSEHSKVCMATTEDHRDPWFPPVSTKPYVVERNLCVFPFIYKGVAHNMCTMTNRFLPWCAIAVDDHHNMTEWGYCEMEYCEEGKPILLIFWTISHLTVSYSNKVILVFFIIFPTKFCVIQKLALQLCACLMSIQQNLWLGKK